MLNLQTHSVVPARAVLNEFGVLVGMLGQNGQVIDEMPRELCGINYGAMFGDSNAAAMYNIAGTLVETQAHGFGAWIGPYSGQRAQIIWNKATGGQEVLKDEGQTNPISVQIDNFLSSPQAAIVTTCLVMAGTNDGDQAPSVVATELERQLRRLSAYKIILLTIPAVGAGAVDGASYEANTTRWKWTLVYNDMIKQIARENPYWIKLLDAHAIGANPLSVKGQAAAGMLYDDATAGLHLNNLYAQRLGKAASDLMTAGMGSQLDWLTSAASVSSLASTSTEKPMNMMAGGLFGTGSPVGTGYAAAVGGGLTQTASIVANPTGYGNAQQLSVTATAQGDFSRLTGPAFNGEVRPGDSLFGQCWVSIPGSSGICAPRLLLTVVMDGVTYTRTALANVTANAAEIDACDLLVRTPQLDLPAGTNITTASLQLTCFASKAGTANSNIITSHWEARRSAAF